MNSEVKKEKNNKWDTEWIKEKKEKKSVGKKKKREKSVGIENNGGMLKN